MLECCITGNEMMISEFFLKKHLMRIRKLILLPWLFLFFSYSCVVAEETDTGQKVKHGIGLSGGYILGSGLTYAHYFGPHIIQGSFIGDVDQYKTDYRVGISYARYVHSVREPKSLLPVALKFIAGVDVHYQDGFVDSEIIFYDDQNISLGPDSYFFHTGAGLGIDIGNPQKPGLVLSLILTYALSLEEVNKKREWELSLLPATGILYNW